MAELYRILCNQCYTYLLKMCRNVLRMDSDSFRQAIIFSFVAHLGISNSISFAIGIIIPFTDSTVVRSKAFGVAGHTMWN